MELPESAVAYDPQPSEGGVVNGAASAVPEAEASSFVPPIAAASLGEAATVGLAPADFWLMPAGVSIHRSSAAAQAADAFFAELSGPRLAVTGAIVPAVG